MNSPVSLADVIEFEALPEHVQELARKVLLDGKEVSKSSSAEELLREAFEEGFEYACEQIDRPYFSESEFTRWYNGRMK